MLTRLTLTAPLVLAPAGTNAPLRAHRPGRSDNMLRNQTFDTAVLQVRAAFEAEGVLFAR